MKPRKVIVVDHYDSYTWNLMHLLGEELGAFPELVLHDQVTLTDLNQATHIVLSPGPGHPADSTFFSVGPALIQAVAAGSMTASVLGVCLGMQGIVTALGGVVGRLPPAHGRVSPVTHQGSGLFSGLSSPLPVVRYHSLAALEVPECLAVTARAGEVVMAVQHRTAPLAGVQFHPESVLSQGGRQLVRNFLR